MHIVRFSTSRRWFQPMRLKAVRGKPRHSTAHKRHLLERLTALKVLEKTGHQIPWQPSGLCGRREKPDPDAG